MKDEMVRIKLIYDSISSIRSSSVYCSNVPYGSYIPDVNLNIIDDEKLKQEVSVVGVIHI